MSHSVNKTTYLDHAATTPLDPLVYEAMLPHLRETYGNPSSIHHIGRAAFDVLEAARSSLARSLAVDTSEIILTGSGTEADNLAIIGLAEAHKDLGKHVIVSSIEHKAVLEAAQQLVKRGFSVTYLPVDAFGLVALETLKDALRDDTVLVSIMYANNEIGTLQPITEISELLDTQYQGTHRPIFHTDACQTIGLLPTLPRTLGVDAMTINSSKIYGPKGIGLLYVQDGVKLQPQLVGGQQEHGRRAGTENVALAVGFAKAVELAVANTESEASRLAALQTHFLTELQTYVPLHTLNGHPTNRLPNNIHITIPHVEGESLLLMLDAAGICAATGSACNASDLAPSHVLTAIGQVDDLIHGSLRFSFGKDTTFEDLTYTARTLGEITRHLLTITASGTAAHQTYAKHT